MKGKKRPPHPPGAPNHLTVERLHQQQTQFLQTRKSISEAGAEAQRAKLRGTENNGLRSHSQAASRAPTAGATLPVK